MECRPVRPDRGLAADPDGRRVWGTCGDEAVAASVPRFRLHALGAFRLVGDAGTVDLGNKKLCGLLAYLAHAAAPQRRDKLMSLLWGSHFQLQAQQNLRKALFRLRRALGVDIVLADDELVWLKPGTVACDVAQFEGLIDEASHESLSAAADLYKDMFLANLSIQEENWVAWMTAERNRLAGRAVDTLVLLGENLEKQGDFQQALETAGRAAALNALREDAHRVIIRSLAAVGRRADSLKHYGQMAALLERELGVKPDAGTRSLADELRAASDQANEQSASTAERQVEDAVLDSAEAAASTSVRPGDRDRQAGSVRVGSTDIAAARANKSRSGWRTYLPFGRPSRARLLTAATVLLVVATTCLALFALRPSWMVAQRPVASLAGGGVPIAVLPFTLGADNAETRRAAELIMDDLPNILPRVPNVRLKPLQAAQLFRTQPLDFTAVADELGAQYVLEGSVRAQGEKLRVNVALVSRGGLQVWSDYFERESVDGDAARDEIVKGVGRSLQVEVIKAERARLASLRSDRPDIDRLLSVGWSAMFGSSSANTLAQAEAAFKEVLKHDPEMPGALIGLAAHHLTIVGDFAVDGDHYLAEAEQLLDQALRRVPEASPPYFYLGILHRIRAELQPALEAFEHSTVLNPSFAPGYAHAGSVLTRLGRMDEALAQIHYAMRISPKDPNFPVWTRFAGTAELESGHDGAALEWYSRALALNPRSSVVHALLAATYALTGDTANAAQYAAKLRQLTAGLSDAQRLEMLGASSKHSEEPHRLLDGYRLALTMPH
jgi:DNA-binding SARP family transcriptional activator/TolB-like protein/Tfp pilus assembly protein PilF